MVNPTQQSTCIWGALFPDGPARTGCWSSTAPWQGVCNRAWQSKSRSLLRLQGVISAGKNGAERKSGEAELCWMVTEQGHHLFSNHCGRGHLVSQPGGTFLPRPACRGGGLAWSRGSTTANIMFEAPRDIDSQTPQSFMLDIKYISKFLSRREAFLPVWLALCISKGKPYRPPFFCYTCCITSSPAKLRTEAFLVASKLQIGMSGKMKTYRVVIPQEKRGAPSIKHFCQLLGKLSSRFSLRRRNL